MKDRPEKTKSAGGVVVNGENRVLVVSQRGDSWSFPKGHIEEGEDAETAARREIYEEAGISELELVKKLGEYQRYKIGKGGMGEDKSELKTITLFLFRTKAKGELKPIDSHHPEARWVEKEKVTDLLTHPKDKEFFMFNMQAIC